MRSDAVESVESSLLLGFAPEDAHVNPGVPKIGTHFSARHRHEADDARVLGRFGKERCNLYANRFGDAVRPAGVTQKRPPPR